jgi:MFS family permease
VLVLVALGQAVRSGIALTLVPLLGEQLGLGRLPLGGALFALALADVAAMHFGAALSDRRGRVVPLAVATAWGAVVALAMAALVTDALWFAVGALAVGVTVGATWVLPMAMIVDLAADPEPALAAGRIASDVGMLAGGLLAGVGIAVAGIAGALVGAAALLVGGLLLTCAVGETLPAAGPSTSRPSTVSPEVRMPLPPIDRLAVLAENQDITLTPQRLAQAHATHAGYRPDLERLRALPLPFLDPTTEPGCAAAWIERGGRS